MLHGAESWPQKRTIGASRRTFYIQVFDCIKCFKNAPWLKRWDEEQNIEDENNNITGMMFQLHQEGCVLRPPSKGHGHVLPGPADSVYMTVDVSVPLAVTVSNHYKSCLLHLHGSHLSPPPFLFPPTSSLSGCLLMSLFPSRRMQSLTADILLPSKDTRSNLSVSIIVLHPLRAGHPV